MPEEIEDVEVRVEVVPISEVPPPRPDHAVNGLEAWFVDDGKISDGSLGRLRSIEIAFEVRGLPQGQKAWIVQSTDKCELVREVRDGEWEWLGEFPSVRDALLVLSKKLG
jgi:hypothetical protein